MNTYIGLFCANAGINTRNIILSFWLGFQLPSGQSIPNKLKSMWSYFRKDGEWIIFTFSKGNSGSQSTNAQKIIMKSNNFQ